MAPPQQQSQGQGDNSLGLMWIGALLVITVSIIWYVGHTQIVRFIFNVKLMEAQFISLFTNNIAKALTYLKTVDPSSVSFDQVDQVAGYVGDYLRYPVILLLILGAITLYLSDARSKFRKTYTMQTLMDQENINWPQITPVRSLNLINEDINKGPWAMGLTPMGFAKKHDMIVVEADTQSRFAKNEGPKVSIKRGLAKQFFTLQIGPYWEGIQQLPIHQKALFAIFAAKMNRDNAGAMALAHQISRSTAKKRLDFSGTDQLINQYHNTKLVQTILEHHAYVMTVMASMISRAREDGVLPTAEFLWLKPLDRPLWYMLNSIGRQTPYVEAAGPFAHWLAEKQLGRRTQMPMVDEAVKALEQAVSEIKYNPEKEY